MDRRAFIGAVTGGLLAAPLAAGAQQAGRSTPERTVLRDLSVALDRPAGGGDGDDHVTVLAPHPSHHRRKETIMGTNESKPVHRVGCRFDAEP